MNECVLCKEDVRLLIDFKNQPIRNRFLKSTVEKEDLHPLIVGQCQKCALVQLINPISAKELKPVFDWITYVEAEDHLDSLAVTLEKLSGLNEDSKMMAISFKDDTLIDRMKKKGFFNSFRLDLKKDLGIDDSCIGVESVQEKINAELISTLKDGHGKQDLIIARHILEHSHNLGEFLNSLKKMLTPTGYIMFEVPDCQSPLETIDYPLIWEEHIIYFTPETFKQTFSYFGFEIIEYKKYDYLFENALVCIARINETVKPTLANIDIINEEKERAGKFADNFEIKKQKVKTFFESLSKHDKIAFLGAGHLACAFINFFELKDNLNFVVDDNPNKKGLYMPGSKLPIYSSKELLIKEIKTCVLSLNPRHENKVIENNKDYLKKGGKFLSIFSDSKYKISEIEVT